MAREKKEENIVVSDNEVSLDMSEIKNHERTEIPIVREDTKVEKEPQTTYYGTNDDNLVNCLRNEKVIVRFIAKARGNITDPRHEAFGQMMKKSVWSFTTPLLRSGGYMDVLTKMEKKYLEYIMNLEPNALSVYRTVNNFWSDANPNGLGRINLKKGDNIFDLSDPKDYIKVKVLMANKDYIASSLSEMNNSPKATHRFVIIRENDSGKEATLHVTLKSKAYMEFGKMSDDDSKMRTVIEILENKPVSPRVSNDFLQGRIGDLIESDTKMFIKVVTDPLLDNKVLLRKAVDAGIVSNRGSFLYLKEDNKPLCDDGQNPTMTVAAKYLSLPKNQELKFLIEAKIKQ